MRKVVIALVVLAIAGAAYYGLMIYPNGQFRSALDRAIAQLPPGYTVHYDSATYSVSTHVAEIAGLSVQGPAPLALNETIAKLTIDGPALDFLDRWNKAATDPAALTPDLAIPVADRITVQDMKTSSSVSSGTVANASLAKLRLYPWALLHQGVPPLKEFGTVVTTAFKTQRDIAAQEAALVAQEEKAADDDAVDSNGDGGANQDQTKNQDQHSPPPSVDLATLQKQQLAALLPVIRIEAAVLLGFGFDSFDGSAFDATTTLTMDQGASPTSFHLVMNTLHEGAIDRAIGGANTIDGMIEEVGQAGKSGKISIDHAAIGKMTMRDPAMRLLNGDPLTPAVVNGLAIETVELDGIAAAVPDGASHIQKVALSNLSFDHGFLTSIAFSLKGLKQNAADMDERGKAGLQQVGLESVTLNMGVDFQWDADKKTASLHDTMLSIDELGSAQLSADFANIDPADMGGDQKPTLVKAVARYQDGSLIDRLLSASGEKDPQKLARIRQQVVAGTLASLGGLASDPKLAGSIKAINDFAKSPHNLTITLSPPTPAPLDALQSQLMEGGPAALVSTLGLSVTANQ